MKHIQIKEINLSNFKGIRNLTIHFDKETNIYGDNGTGKTTIFDAFTWLFFGKDSNNRKDFEVKTLDHNNTVIPKIEHEVSAIIEVDGDTITLRRILKENWVKKRGSLEAEFSGNATDYYWNDVPLQQKAFQEKVSHILDESVFKMITNPLAFNAMKWQDRREALIKIVGEVSDEDIAKGDTNYEKLIAQLRNGKTLDDYRKQIHASVKKAKDDLKAIPTRIDEVSKSLPEVYDFAALENELQDKKNAITTIEEQITDKSKAFDAKLDVINTQKLKVNTLKNEISTIEDAAHRRAVKESTPDTSKMDGLKLELETLNADFESSEKGLHTLQTKHQTLTSKLSQSDKAIANKRQEWEAENKKTITFNDDNFCCPTCNRALDATDIEAKKQEMQEQFIKDKQSKLDAISAHGKLLSNERNAQQSELDFLFARIEKGATHIQELKQKIKTLTDEFNQEEPKSDTSQGLSKDLIYESILSMDADYKDKNSALKKLEESIEAIPVIDTAELKKQKEALTKEIDTLKTKLLNKERIVAVNNRIAELQEEESRLAQQIMDVEKEQFTIENFNKLKIDTLEAKINSNFKFVKFKMFTTQINGGETESCEALIDGVPFSDANTASKINAGLDIINTLCDYYQVTAPIFIDNRESIVELIPTESQVINLIVWQGSSLSVGNPKIDGQAAGITKEQLTIEI